MPYTEFDLKTYRDRVEEFVVYSGDARRLCIYLEFGKVGAVCSKVKDVVEGLYGLAYIKEGLIEDFGDILCSIAMYTRVYPFGVRPQEVMNVEDWFSVPIFDFEEYKSYSFFEAIALLQNQLCSFFVDVGADDSDLLDIDIQEQIDEGVWDVLILMNYCLSMVGTHLFSVAENNLLKLGKGQTGKSLKKIEGK